MRAGGSFKRRRRSSGNRSHRATRIQPALAVEWVGTGSAKIVGGLLQLRANLGRIAATHRRDQRRGDTRDVRGRETGARAKQQGETPARRAPGPVNDGRRQWSAGERRWRL